MIKNKGRTTNHMNNRRNINSKKLILSTLAVRVLSTMNYGIPEIRKRRITVLPASFFFPHLPYCNSNQIEGYTERDNLLPSLII